jgi:peptidyl-dipeptidase A
MDPDAFAEETDRLYGQLEPLYRDLHCHVRAQLNALHGADVVSLDKPIPAHLLGNMWAQSWGNLFDLLAPEQGTSLDLDAILAKKYPEPTDMVRQAESFFTSLGMDALPATFWERSMFVKPPDREVVCHASAWDIDWRDDLRIKMCIRPTLDEFITIHHELGHNYYQRAYKDLSALFTDSANDGFHEALGDVLALSVTPSYLVQIGVLDTLPPDNLNPLMRQALDKVAFLPFGLMVDRWRWGVLSGETPPERYTADWWELREKYQGVAAPIERTSEDFDPGGKYHVPGGVPYTRYFLASILQFQFHRALCKQIGHEGPLHTCSIYGHEKAGAKIEAMMKMGLSRPWPDALEAITGSREMDASAIIEYFAPLHTWLKEQNRGRICGW